MSILEQVDIDETDNEIHQIDNCDITSSSIDISSDNGKVKLCNCNNPYNCYCKRKLKISVLTKQEDIVCVWIPSLRFQAAFCSFFFFFFCFHAFWSIAVTVQ